MKLTTPTSPDAVRVLRVFLASPSDLGPERHAARDAVNEINRTVARPAGFQVDLIGWEDTLSSAGRPQATINEEMATCQMFIGMIWERWGTAPDLTGKFTSGFEEEYYTSFDRYEKTGQPHMRLFFKDVDSSKISDAGPELSKVIDFKKKRISDKLILFQSFTDTETFAQYVRVGIADYILKLKSEDQLGDDASRSTDLSPEPAPPANSEPGSPKSELDLLNILTAKLQKSRGAAVTAVDVARLRNLAVALSGPSNDDNSLGPHDANLIYATHNQLKLSEREVTALANAGIDAIDRENAPVFFWISKRSSAFPPWLAYGTFIGPDARQVNVFRIMQLIRHDIGEVDEAFSRKDIIARWFTSDSDGVKTAALNYLQRMARPGEIVFAQAELDKSSFGTRVSAAEAVISLSLRDSGVKEALAALNTVAFTIDTKILNDVLSSMEQLDSQSLKIALGHSSQKVREKALAILAERQAVDADDLDGLLNDHAISIRNLALTTYIGLGRDFTDKEAEDVLVRRKSPSLSGVGSSSENEGTDELSAFKKKRRKIRPIADLVADRESSPLWGEDAYFALCERDTAKYIDDLRLNFEDRFLKFHEKMCENLERTYPSTDAAKTVSSMMAKHEKFRRRLWMREAADIIIVQKSVDDLSRIRSALDGDMLDPRVSDINYLALLGSFEDITRIDKAAGDYRIGGDDGGLLTTVFPRREAAKAMLKLAGGKLGNLLGSGISDAAIPSVLAEALRANFLDLSESQKFGLLNHDAANVRKAIVLKMLRYQTMASLKAMLARYVGSDKHRYYNVIVWLDLAVAFPAATVRSVAERELRKIQ